MEICELIVEKLDILGDMPFELKVREIIGDIQSLYPGTPAELIVLAVLRVRDSQILDSKIKRLLNIELVDGIFIERI